MERFDSNEETGFVAMSYKEGVEARHSGTTIQTCPYDESAIVFRKSWRAGWSDQDQGMSHPPCTPGNPCMVEGCTICGGDRN